MVFATEDTRSNLHRLGMILAGLIGGLIALRVLRIGLFFVGVRVRSCGSVLMGRCILMVDVDHAPVGSFWWTWTE